MLLWIDGFDAYGATGVAPAPTGIVGQKYSVINNESDFRVVTGRYAGFALNLPYNSVRYFGANSLTTNATVVAGFAVKFSNLDSSYQFFGLYDGAQDGVGLWSESTGEISVKRDGTLLATSVGANILVNVWYYIELKVKCASGTSGTYELRVNGINVASSTGANTKAGANSYHDGFRFAGTTGLHDMIVDDFYFLDATGSVNNSFLSLKRVVTIFPDAAGDLDQWTASTGPSYNMVNENPQDGDTTYVESSTSGQEDLWNYGAVGATGPVAGIQVSTDCRMTGATGYTLITQEKNGGVDSTGVSQPISSSSYTTKRQVFETNPRTSAPWNVTDLNSTQFGVKIV